MGAQSSLRMYSLNVHTNQNGFGESFDLNIRVYIETSLYGTVYKNDFLHFPPLLLLDVSYIFVYSPRLQILFPFNGEEETFRNV